MYQATFSETNILLRLFFLFVCFFNFFPSFLCFGIFLRENEARLRIAAHS